MILGRWRGSVRLNEAERFICLYNCRRLHNAITTTTAAAAAAGGGGLVWLTTFKNE